MGPVRFSLRAGRLKGYGPVREGRPHVKISRVLRGEECGRQAIGNEAGRMFQIEGSRKAQERETMRKTRCMKWFAGVVIAATFWTAGARAADPVNTAFVGAEIYLWNRLADFTEILQSGVAIGPCIGGEFAITKYGTVGAYVANEQGVAFPHFIPPLWIINYLDDQQIFTPHKGLYETRAFINDHRWENTPMEDVRFPRGPWDIRAQVAAGLIHISLSVQTMQVYDFLAGLICFDPLADDQARDPTAPRQPARQLGRGVVNIVAGVVEIPVNMNQINEEKGGFAAVSYGLARGVWRTGVRMGVGVLEVVTFPMGWEPIIEPEFPFEPTKATNWRVSQPAFRRQY